MAATANQATTVLVTGASGFIASHCIRLLLEEGYKVRGTVRSLSDAKKVAPLYQLTPRAKDNLQLIEADLVDPESWPAAVEGCTFVLHVASPFPGAMPADEQVLIKPAVEGTLNVLRACAAAEPRTVKRVVLTSSVAAVAGQDVPDYTKSYSEQDWTDLTGTVAAYQKSKTLAEQAAWKFLEELPDSSKLELAAINPSYVMGPICHGSVGTSQELIGRLMRREVPALPHIGMEMCDVRDVALAHVRAMTLPDANGQRFIINTGGMWFRDVALVLEREFKHQGYNIPTMMAPKLFVSIAACFDKTLHSVMPRWGKQLTFDNTKMRNILKIEPTSREETVIEMAHSMVDHGLVPRTKDYRGRTLAAGRRVE
ncbi:putative uncharacterized oxidoreductase [Hypsibius exemplaris]|uniref:Uncharacterized oxidoreductase n=1 Tax=Hypsibius exemplaris TaxID=2072580 RepID=A0A1W0X5R1_HYPEX|nr:putative uncharacterized oxidoreductase [Hypsibius exemplaris]